MNQYSNEDLKTILGKGWLTHDAMWVKAVHDEFGAEAASRLNKRAIALMAPIEAKRLAKVFGFKELTLFEDLKTFVTETFAVVSGDFTDFRITFPSHNRLRWDAPQCFAHDGIKALGMIDQYDCGIFERIEGWFNGLGIKYDILPKVSGCMMRSQGECYREIQFYFEAPQ